MKRHHVESSALESVGYDRERKILELEFRDNGGVWQYLNLPPSVYNKFNRAKSRGKFFVTKIKGKYPEEKIEYMH